MHPKRPIGLGGVPYEELQGRHVYKCRNSIMAFSSTDQTNTVAFPVAGLKLADRTTCWICRINPADSAEHFIKRATLAKMFPAGEVKTVFHETPAFSFYQLAHLRSPGSKLPKQICTQCNSSKTQKHDVAWDAFFQALSNAQLPNGDIPFPPGTFNESHMQLYLAKIFGCMVAYDQSTNAILPKLGIASQAILDSLGDSILTNAKNPSLVVRASKLDSAVSHNISAQLKKQEKTSNDSWVAVSPLTALAPSITGAAITLLELSMAFNGHHLQVFYNLGSGALAMYQQGNVTVGTATL